MAKHGVGRPIVTVPSCCLSFFVLYFSFCFVFISSLFAGSVFHSELRNWPHLSRLIELTLGRTNIQPGATTAKEEEKKEKKT